MRHQDAVLASDVAGRSLRGDVHATLDGTLPGGGPALCDAAPFHPGQGEHDRHREFAEDRGGVDAEVDDRESGALVVDVLDELESVADAGPERRSRRATAIPPVCPLSIRLRIASSPGRVSLPPVWSRSVSQWAMWTPRSLAHASMRSLWTAGEMKLSPSRLPTRLTRM